MDVRTGLREQTRTERHPAASNSGKSLLGLGGEVEGMKYCTGTQGAWAPWGETCLQLLNGPQREMQLLQEIGPQGGRKWKRNTLTSSLPTLWSPEAYQSQLTRESGCAVYKDQSPLHKARQRRVENWWEGGRQNNRHTGKGCFLICKLAGWTVPSSQCYSD